MEATKHNNPLHKRQGKDRALILQFIISKVENGTGKTLSELNPSCS